MVTTGFVTEYSAEYLVITTNVLYVLNGLVTARVAMLDLFVPLALAQQRQVLCAWYFTEISFTHSLLLCSFRGVRDAVTSQNIQRTYKLFGFFPEIVADGFGEPLSKLFRPERKP